MDKDHYLCFSCFKCILIWCLLMLFIFRNKTKADSVVCLGDGAHCFWVLLAQLFQRTHDLLSLELTLGRHWISSDSPWALTGGLTLDGKSKGLAGQLQTRGARLQTVPSNCCSCAHCSLGFHPAWRAPPLLSLGKGCTCRAIPARPALGPHPLSAQHLVLPFRVT